MELSKEDVKHVALLARLGVTEEDVEKFRGQLSHILENFEILKEVNTDNVEPTSHCIPINTVMRDDEIRPSLSQEEVLANAPRQEDGHFKVRAVLE